MAGMFKPFATCLALSCLALLNLAAPASAQDAAPETVPAVAPATIPETIPATITETITVVLETTMSEITIALETQAAPITAGNFLRYSEEDRFDGATFYRAMQLAWEAPNGLIQGGARNDPERILPPIAHEPTSQTGVLHKAGVISMAMGEPGTANGDFFIVLRDTPSLDADPEAGEAGRQHGFAAFGHVISGMDVVHAIHAAPIDPELGDGWMKGQMLAEPVVIVDARVLRAPSPAVP